MESITCLRCGLPFTHDKTGRKPVRCPVCRVAHRREQSAQRQAAWRAANPERAKEHQNRHNRARLSTPEYRQLNRERMVLAKYGLTPAQLAALIEAQGNRCAICGGERNGPGTRLHIDHCHDTGKVRGMLCTKCNTAIGLLDDDPTRAEQVARYLRT